MSRAILAPYGEIMLFKSKIKENRLSDELEKKYDLYGNAHSDEFISDIFTLEEFIEVFKNKHSQFCFCYQSMPFTIFNCGKYAEFWIDGEEHDSYKKFESAEKLLENFSLKGKSLNEIWSNLTVFA